MMNQSQLRLMMRNQKPMRQSDMKLIGQRLEAFSLVEISMVLLIIGIIAGGMLKGRDLIESAQIRCVLNDFQNLQTVFDSYINSYGSIPGDDSSASAKFQDVSDGDGDGVVSPDDAKNVFSHLFAAGLIESASFKKPKVGGTYDVVSEEDSVKLRISNSGIASLTRRQALAIIAKANETFGPDADIVETDPKLSKESSQKYVVKLRIK